jgi:oligoendopeptidase F
MKEEISEIRRDLQRNFTDFFNRLNEWKTELQAQDERRISVLHNRVNDVSRELAAVNERTKHL